MQKLFLVLLVLTATLPVTAQNFSKTGVKAMQLRNSGAIVSGGQVTGYYQFYNVEKQDRKNNNYLLSLYDENLRQISEVNIVRPTSYLLIDAVYNGSAFGFLFYDARSKTVELMAYDKTLKETGSVKKEVSNKMGQATYQMIAQGNDPSQAYLVGVPNKGFIYYGLKDGNKAQFEIEAFDNSMRKMWSNKASENAMNIEMGTEAFQDEQYVGSLIVKKKNQTSKDMEFDLLVQHLADGKVLFRVPMVTTKYSVSLSEVIYDKVKQKFVVFGECYDIDDKQLKNQSLGFITLEMDMSGKVVYEKVNTWKNEISKATPVNEKGKFDGSNTNILFHDIIRTSDGQLFAIGEQYKKAASAGGIALTALSIAAGGGGSQVATVQLNVYNMVIFQFDPDYTVKKVHIFDKDKNVVTLPAGAGYMSSKLLSYYAKAIGGFDYIYTQPSKDKSTFVVSYINYDREKGEKNKNILGSIVYTPEKTFSVDKLPLNRKSSDYYVFQGKEGYVLITEYFRKERRLDSRLEKINF